MLFKTRFGTPAKGGLTMTVPLVVIARSEATKQSIFLCLFKRRDCRGSLGSPRNDRREEKIWDCHSRLWRACNDSSARCHCE